MRTIKLSLVSLFALLSLLAFGNRLFPVFVAAGQAVVLNAPTGVVASDNTYSTKVGITWSAVRGATLYRIFRHTSNDSSAALNLGTTVEGAFFDTTAPAGQNFFYWVRAENGSVVSSLSEPDQGSRANGIINGQVQPLNPPPVPAGNPVTATKAYLGKTLFWDEQLSSTRTVACGTCHFAANGGSDSRAIVNSARATNPGADGLFGTADDVYASPGVLSNNADGTYNWSTIYGFREQVTGRKSKSYIDAAYSPALFWDGRATPVFTDPLSGAVVLPNGAALESQVLGPPVSSAEMAHAGRDWNDVAARVSVSKPLALSPTIPAGLKEWIDGRSYPELFAEAFGTSEVTPARIALAIATFERTLYSDRTPFDASVSQITPLSAAEARGQAVFNQSRCNTCHAGNLFSDNQFHNIGLRPQTEDTGRFQVTGNTNNIGEFRTPSLRNVELRAPYMHNGHFATLEEVVEFYNRGGDFDAPNIDRTRIHPLNLSAQQKADLVAFLKRPLTDPRVAAGTSPFDRPTLYAESDRVPQITGNGTQGAGGSIPQVVAIEPPLLGNPGFTVGVSKALGGAQAVLVIDAHDPGTGPNIPQAGSFARVAVQLSGNGAGQGYGSASLQIPNISALIGSTFYGRWYVTDANAANSVAVTPAFKMTIFGEPISTPTASPVNLSGRVNTSDGTPLGGVTVNLGGNALDRTITDSDGFYRFSNLTANAIYVVTPKLANYTFTPESRSFSLVADKTDATFTAAAIAPVDNPLNSGDFFVRQQYLDFLGREPERDGWLYWTDQIALCGTDARCQLQRDIDVSAAFFIENEFQQTGSYVYRMYTASLGRQPGYAEFGTDRTQIVAGANLSQSKAAFADAWVQRQAFINRYGANPAPDSFVDALLATLKGYDGVDLSSKRATYIGELQGGATRGQIVREAAEDASVQSAEYNPSFVLMQYFGYLHRDPDVGGYQFWLNVLNNREPNNYRGMVCSFITSAEYQKRFSTVVTHSNQECGQ